MSSKIYQLSHTGPEVDEAIAKIKDLDLDEVNGGITELTSSDTNPFNVNILSWVWDLQSGICRSHHLP